MSTPVAVLSAAEQEFERRRQLFGLIAGPLLFAILLFAAPAGLEPAAQRLLAVVALVVIFWVTEAIPLAATALMGPALCVVLGVASAKAVFQPFAHPLIFVYLGGFLLAQGMLEHGLNRRVAYRILGSNFVAKGTTRLLLGFGFLAALLSMWVSNTATAAILFPIGVATLTQMEEAGEGKGDARAMARFGGAIMLAIAYGASIGGIATPVGTPPNLVAKGIFETQLDVHISFFQWMAFGVPLSALMLGFMVWKFQRQFAGASLNVGVGREVIRELAAKLGPMSRAERNVLLAFGTTVTMWLLPGFMVVIGAGDTALGRWLDERLPESVAAVLGASLLFLLPINFARREFTLTWRSANRIDWGTILLFGGGLSIGDLMFTTGLAGWIGDGAAGLFDTRTTLTLVMLFAVVAMAISEMTSNLATANMLLPVAIAVSRAADVDPLLPALAACLGCSMAFMLPVSTPPNAIVYGSGRVSLPQMMRSGVTMNLAGFVVIVLIVMLWAPVVLGR